jgi:hypothetical protein
MGGGGGGGTLGRRLGRPFSPAARDRHQPGRSHSREGGSCMRSAPPSLGVQVAQVKVTVNYGPNSYKDTKTQMLSLLVFNGVFRLDMHTVSHVGIFDPSGELAPL